MQERLQFIKKLTCSYMRTVKYNSGNLFIYNIISQMYRQQVPALLNTLPHIRKAFLKCA